MRTLMLVLALTALAPSYSKGDTMCTGAEAPAAASAKGAADVGATAGSLAAANVAGATGGDALGTLIAGNAANWGVSIAPELAAGAAGAAAGAASSGGGTGLTLSNVSAGASAANAGLGLLSAIKGSKVPAAPQLLPPTVMPTTDDLTVRRAKAAELNALARRRGRASTILSNDTLGGN